MLDHAPDTDSPTQRANVPPERRAGGATRAFVVADRLAVHASDCVCPRCAGRLPALMSELARALGDTDARPSGRAD